MFDIGLKITDEIFVSEKFARQGAPCHHVNDVCAIGSSLYVTIFSQTGNWKQDVFDGAVLEFDTRTHDIVGAVVTDLWMPHSVDFIEGSLTVLDSLRGQLKRENAVSVGQFPGFYRVLAYDGQYFYVGQTRTGTSVVTSDCLRTSPSTLPSYCSISLQRSLVA